MLTANSCWGHESLHNLRIHIHTQILLLDNPGISLVDTLFYPTRECVINSSVDDVAEPLLWKLIPLLFLWQILHTYAELGDKILYLLDTETFVLRDTQMFDLISFDLLSCSRYKVLQKATKKLEIWMIYLLDCYSCVMWKVSLAIESQEEIDFLLALEFVCNLCGSD